MGRKLAHFLATAFTAAAVVPANWAERRSQSEYSHAANAVMTFAALCCAVLAQPTARDWAICDLSGNSRPT